MARFPARATVRRSIIPALVGAAWCSTATAQNVPTFTDSTASCGVAVSHAPAASYLLSFLNTVAMTGGAAVADFNNDGFQDIYLVTTGASADKLFINNGNGTFTDRAAEWGVGDLHMGIGVSAADYNADGLIDLYITSLGPSSSEPQIGRHKLLRNNGGSFTNVATAARVNRTTTILPDGFGSTWGDYDLDGDLDLYVVSWIPSSGGNRLFRNNSNGAFTDVTVSTGVSDLTLRGFSPRFVDMDNDHYPELIVTGDFDSSRYYLNMRGRFANITQTTGTAVDDNGMGSTVGDFNNDGFLDWYVTSIYTTHPIAGVPGTGNMLYINLGEHSFIEGSRPAGVNHAGWGWGTVATDFNHDGHQDIIATNGWSQSNSIGAPEWQFDPSVAFLNQGNATFTNVSAQTNINLHTAQGRAMCAIDIENDGDQDLFIVNYNSLCTILRSNLITDGHTPPDAHWLRVALDTSASAQRLAPNGYGSRLRVTTDAGTQYRYFSPGCTYIGQSEATAHFGVGSASTINEVVVEWNNGRTTRLSGVPSDQTIAIRYCAGDWNGDTSVTSSDLFAFLEDLFALSADFNANGLTDSQDFFDYLTAFYTGCP